MSIITGIGNEDGDEKEDEEEEALDKIVASLAFCGIGFRRQFFPVGSHTSAFPIPPGSGWDLPGRISGSWGIAALKAGLYGGVRRQIAAQAATALFFVLTSAECG